MEFYFERQDVKGGGRIRLPEGTVSIGRSPKSTIALPANERCVSAIHAVVYADPRRLLLQDMQSTNGTFVNGRQVNECVLEAGDEVRLGRSGPVFRVVGGGAAESKGFDYYGASGLDAGVPQSPSSGFSSGALQAVPEVRGVGVDCIGVDDEDDDAGINADGGYPARFGQNNAATIPESAEKAHAPDDRDRPRIRAVHVIIAIAAVVVLGLSAILVLTLTSSKSTQIPPSTPANPTPQPGKKGFFTQPGDQSSTMPKSTPAQELSTTPMTPTASMPASVDADTEDNNVPRRPISSASTIEKIDAVLTRFGETDYRTPPEMVERVEHYLGFYTGPNRHTAAKWLKRSEQYFPMIRRVFTEKNIPLELAYVSMLESGFNTTVVSHAGAVGLWQFMPHTARRYGLEVSSRIDERTDPEKATYAAAAFFKHLIAIFGARSSVMLCMAAYNAGEQRIINALKRIDDPMRDRDFWYLYRMGWLADETNEYIPQIIALIIISENLEEYGF